MPRKEFHSDLRNTIKLHSHVEVSNLRAGEDDGTLSFNYTLSAPDTIEVAIQALVPDLSDYPNSHKYFLYTSSDNVSRIVTTALQNLTDQSSGMRVDLLVQSICSTLLAAHMPRPNHEEDHESWPTGDGPGHFKPQSSPDTTDEEDFDVDEQDDDSWMHDVMQDDVNLRRNQNTFSVTLSRSNSDLCNLSRMEARIRNDLRLTKYAGFKVAFVNHPLQKGVSKFLSISCRIRKLGLSDEALQAWQLDGEQYLVLLIHYAEGYIAAEELAQTRSVEYRIGTCLRYKPSLDEARGAFRSESSNSKNLSTLAIPINPQGFSEVFMSTSLNALMNGRFAMLLWSRMEYGIPWSGAMTWYKDYFLKGAMFQGGIPDEVYSESDTPKGTLPSIVTADHLIEGIDAPSMPLLAMQLVLRHFVRCTEFCLVCHQKVQADFEALKPFVCDTPLCLYQYMSLGLGPSIEHEIISRPSVVDLLISFCYSSALNGRLRSFPNGMALVLPQMQPTRDDFLPELPPASKDARSQLHNADYYESRNELLFTSVSERFLKVGEWITIYFDGKKRPPIHCRVNDASAYPLHHLSPPISVITTPEPASPPPTLPPPTDSQNDEGGWSKPLPNPASVPVDFAVYNDQFDELKSDQKCRAIVLLLDILPSVQEMREYLLKHKNSCEASLKYWTERIPSAVLGILRWIIASNRSFIIQVDDLDTPNEARRASKNRITGMEGWLQFRFAQGAPDQAQRFIHARSSVAERLGLEYPTIFAWHGSPLYNWHGIIREGLDFKETLHGRVYGNGCYHSLNLATSLCYSHALPSGQHSWRQSALGIHSVVCLNEIVNAPKEYVSVDPHLVVAQLDWIQTRYLFVKCENYPYIPENNDPQLVHPQDPLMTPIGASQQKIVLPYCATANYQSPAAIERGTAAERETRARDHLSEECLTDETDAEDLEFININHASSIDLYPNINVRDNNEGKKNETEEGDEMQMEWEAVPKSEFVSDITDESVLPLLGPPTYATSLATSALSRELKAILKIQDTEPSGEIGWYINPEFVRNVYQWILELHSFDPSLPLSKDMAEKRIKSIVIEMRFGSDYPMSPPFVRVVSPRFLPFMNGGGGHVTAGGALCMELLTNSGWTSASTIESVLLQVRLAISSTEPRPARLAKDPESSYGSAEALEAFVRACRTHGWEIPKTIHNFITG